MTQHTDPSLHNDDHSPLSLQALLANIEKNTAPFLAQGREELHQQSIRNIRKKTLHITFFLHSIELGLPISAIQAVDHFPDITPLPNIPPWILGITNIQGEIISVVDVKKYFRLPPPQGHGRTHASSYYILLSDGRTKLAITVDRLSGIVGLDSQIDRLSPPSLPGDDTKNSLTACLRGMLNTGQRSIALIDEVQLLNALALKDEAVQ